MYKSVLSVELVELSIENQKIIEAIAESLNIEYIINRQGFIFYMFQNFTLNNVYDLLKDIKWHTPMKWGAFINSPVIIKSIYLKINDIVQTGYMNIIPFSPTINVPQIDWRHNLDKLKKQLAEYQLMNDEFCEYYARLFVNADLYAIEHTKHNLPVSVWTKFGHEAEHRFIPIKNAILTVLPCKVNGLIGIEALIADIVNMIYKDVKYFKLPNMYLLNYSYENHIQNVTKYMQKYARDLNVNNIHAEYIKYYSADKYSNLVQKYSELAGEVSKLIYVNHANIIDAVVKLMPTNDASIDLVIMCICYDKIIWAQTNDCLPTGNKDPFGIKRNIRTLINIWQLHAEKFTIYNDLPESIQKYIRNYICKSNPFMRKVANEYLNAMLNPTEAHLQMLTRIINIGKKCANGDVNHELLNLCKISKFNELLETTNEYLNQNIIMGNKQNEALLNKIYQFINQLTV